MTRRPTMLKHSRPTVHLRKKNTSIFIGIQEVHHKKSTLEAHEVMKLHYHDLTSSNDEFSSKRTINQAHIHKINDPSGEQRYPRFLFRRSDAV